MKYNKVISGMIVGALGMSMLGTALANEVQYTVNKPTTIVYQVAHQNFGESPVLSARQTIAIDHAGAVFVDLKGYQFAGVVTDRIDGRELPANAKQFGRMDSCTVSTTREHTTGTLSVTIKPHEISCVHVN